MAAKHHVVRLGVEYLDHEAGHWCNTCLLSTGFRFWVVCRQNDRMDLRQRLHCYECGGHDITLDHPVP